MRRALAGLLAAGLLAGCGAPSADLFVVTRSGKDHNANLKLLVSDDGTVRCNSASRSRWGRSACSTRASSRATSRSRPRSGSSCRSEKGSILAYKVRLEAGTIAFADTSRGLPKTFSRVEAFTADVAERVCKIRRE